jgi:hypothetical protein
MPGLPDGLGVIPEVYDVRVLSRAVLDHFLDRCGLTIFHHLGAFGAIYQGVCEKSRCTKYETADEACYDDHWRAHASNTVTSRKSAATRTKKLGIDLLSIGKRAGSV